MPTLLHIESATLTCSVAISRGGEVISLQESHDSSYAHSEKLVVFIDEALKEADIGAADLDGVCVSKGPGSYTGLRIGVSAAKGLCYSCDIPLLSVGSLESMTHALVSQQGNLLPMFHFLCPMIDARRMEVYTALFDASLKQVRAVSAEIITENSFAAELEMGKVAFFGDGAAKCREVLKHKNALFVSDFSPTAASMMTLAEKKFKSGMDEDLAYFEPYYLKDFVAGVPKRLF